MSEVVDSPKKSNGVYILIMLLLLAGMGVMTFLWSSKNGELNECVQKNNEYASEIEGMNQMMAGYVDNMSNDLRKDFKNMLATYDALMEKDASKAKEIEEQKAKIEELIAQVDRGKMTGYELAKMRKENETLRSIMRSYVYQIDSLNTLNLKLTSDLDRTTTELVSTQSERDQFKTEAETANEQVRKGSKLQAYGFTSEGLRMKLNDVMEPTTRARNAVQIRSSFTVSENPITKAGRKAVYMQVVAPDGKTLQSRSSNVVDTDSGAIPYSDKKEIDYQNERVDMTIYYDLRGEEAQKGNYKVKIYCDGQLIGSDSFTLK